MHPSQSTFSISTTTANSNQIIIPMGISFPQVVQVVNAEELPFTSQCICPLIVVNEQYSQEFQFNIKREPVDDKFWDECKEKLEKKSFNELFNSFLLTNWEPRELYKQDLKLVQENILKRKKFKEEMIKSVDVVFYYDSLVKIFLYTNFKFRAMCLVHAIMDLGNLNLQLNELQSTNKAEIINHKRKRKIDCINNQYDLLFTKIYLPYQAYLKKADSQKTVADIIVLRSTIYSLKGSSAKYQKETKDVHLIKKYLPLINECLLNFRLYQKIPYYVYKKSSIAPTLFVSTAAFQEQESTQPPKKKRCLLLADPNTSASFINPLLQPSSFTHSQYKTACTSGMLENTAQYQKQINDSSYLKNSEAPTVSLHYQSDLNKLDSYDVNEIKFITFLNKIMGKETYFYYEIDMIDDEKNKSLNFEPEKYYRSLVILSALNAKVLLLKMKMLTMELIQAEIKNANKANIQRKLREKIFTFMNNHLNYEENIAILSGRKKNQQFENVSINFMKCSYFSNFKNIKSILTQLEDAQIKYNEMIQNYDENKVMKRHVEFINSLAVMDRIRNTYALSNKKANQIVRSVLNISSLNETQKNLLTLKFQINRPSVDDSFWQALKNENLSELDLKRYFCRFIWTSWKSTPSKIRELENTIREARDNHLDLQLRANLIEKNFQEKLRYQVFFFIHHILKIIEKCQRLKNLSLNNKVERKRIEREIEVSLINIKGIYQKVLTAHLDYLTARKSVACVDINKLDSEIKTYQYYIDSNTKIDTENTRMHIVLINKILDDFDKNQFFSYTTLLVLIRDYINNSTSTTPIFTPPAESYRLKQLQFVPVANVVEPSVQALALSPVQSKEERCTCQSNISAPIMTFDSQQHYGSEDMDLQYQTLMQHLYSIPSPEQFQLSSSENVSTSAVNLLSDTDQLSLKAISCDTAEIKLTSLLNKMIGKDVYSYHEIDMDNEIKKNDLNFSYEKYYNSLIMLSALNAQTLLLKMKILTVELTQAETKNDKASIRKKLRAKFTAFMNNHFTYEENIAISLNRKNQQPIGVSDNYIIYNYLSNCNGIKAVITLLAEVQQKYNETIQKIDESILLKSYFEFINSSMVMSKIRNNYFLPHTKIKQVIESILSTPVTPSLTQEQLAALKFQIDRPSVDNSFWQSLKNENLPESEFRQCYFRFILTNWRSSLNEIYELDKAIKEAGYNPLDLQLRANLVDKHFQEKFRYQAFHLIHHILQATEKSYRLKNLPSDNLEKKKIEHEIRASLNKIGGNYQKALIIHSDYLVARKSLDSVNVGKLYGEIKTCQNYIHNHRTIDTEDTESHILLINKILENIEKNQPFSSSAVLELIYNYVNDNSDVTSTSAITSKSHAPQQLQFVPVDKLSMQDPQTFTMLQLEPVDTQFLLPSDEVKVEPATVDMDFSIAEPFWSPVDILTLKNESLSINTNHGPNHGQALKPSIELEQEQISEQQALYVGEVNTLDFLNR